MISGALTQLQNMIKMIRKFLIPIFAVLLIGALSLLYKNYYSHKKNLPVIKENVILETYRSEIGWGYKIFKNGRVYINQQYIPVIRGKTPFATKEEAKKVGEVVLEKVKNSEAPYITEQVLDSLKVGY